MCFSRARHVFLDVDPATLWLDRKEHGPLYFLVLDIDNPLRRLEYIDFTTIMTGLVAQ